MVFLKEEGIYEEVQFHPQMPANVATLTP